MANEFNFQLPPEGFDSYLLGILPENIAVTAGAFAVSMQQIKNIQNIDAQKFAKTVYSIETNNGLPLTNGTNVPTEVFVVDNALSKVALGSGLYGTYTHSDFVGSMTGLPYPLQNIYDGILQLQTDNLTNIYKQIWAICTYGTATASIQYETYQDPATSLTYYTITGITITNAGGGYTSVPSYTIGGGSGATFTFEIGTDSENPATYNRISKITLTSAGVDTTSPPTITINPPANDAYGSPTNPTACANRNTALDNLITQANTEIQNIALNEQNFEKARLLNANWNQLGTALKIEQRARYTAIPPVPIPRDPFLALYPTALYNFVDSIPEYAANTMPHGPAQSLEMMSDQCSVGGQSLIGMMRQQRNQDRLDAIGIPLDNNIPNTMSIEDQRQIMANGTKCGATKNTVDSEGNMIPGAGIQAENGLSFTMPAFPITQNCANETLTPEKTNTYDDIEGALRKHETSEPGSINTLLVDPPCNAIAGPTIPTGDSILLGTGIPSITEDETANVLPILLNIDYSSGTLLPSQYDVPNAIDQVIECNCDCWVN